MEVTALDSLLCDKRDNFQGMSYLISCMTKEKVKTLRELKSLYEVDHDVYQIVAKELERQKEGLELIASEVPM
jgi:hypothetical protein